MGKSETSCDTRRASPRAENQMMAPPREGPALPAEDFGAYGTEANLPRYL